MANDLSTPSVGLQVQEQRAQTQQAPMVDVSGVAQGQPDWKALGEAGRKFSNTVNDLFQETSAKYELLKYQQELGDIERRYITSPGNGSPEEMQKLQAETDKAWNRFKTATGKLNSDKAIAVIGEANEYGIRYRDSLLNQQAKFAEDFYQKNQEATIAAYAEDYVFNATNYNSEAFKKSDADLTRELTNLLVHNGFSQDDPHFKDTLAKAKSTAILGTVKFHVANKDYSKGWAVYTHFVKEGVLTGENRTSALSILQILKDELAAKAASSSGSTDNIAYNLATGRLDPRQFEIVSAERSAQKRANELQRYNAATDEWFKNREAYNKAVAAGGQIQADGSVIDPKTGYRIEAPGLRPTRKTDAQLEMEARFEVEQINLQNRKLYQAGGYIPGSVNITLQDMRASGKIDQNTLLTATPEQLVAATGLFSRGQEAQVVASIRQNLGENGFSEWLDYVRYGVVRNVGDYYASQVSAENMTTDEFIDIQAEAVEKNVHPAQIISTRYQLPLGPAYDVANKMLKYCSNPDNTYASDLERKFIEPNYNLISNIVAPKFGFNDGIAIEAFKKSESNKRIIREISVQALHELVSTNADLIAVRETAAKKDGRGLSPDQFMYASYEYLATNAKLQKEFFNRVEELAQERFEQQEGYLGRKSAKTEVVGMYGKNYVVPAIAMPAATSTGYQPMFDVGDYLAGTITKTSEGLSHKLDSINNRLIKPINNEIISLINTASNAKNIDADKLLFKIDNDLSKIKDVMTDYGYDFSNDAYSRLPDTPNSRDTAMSIYRALGEYKRALTIAANLHNGGPDMLDNFNKISQIQTNMSRLINLIGSLEGAQSELQARQSGHINNYVSAINSLPSDPQYREPAQPNDNYAVDNYVPAITNLRGNGEQ